MHCGHVRMLYGHMRMRERVTVKVTKYKIGINCISLEISLHVESCKPMRNFSLYVIKCMRGGSMFHLYAEGEISFPRDVT